MAFEEHPQLLFAEWATNRRRGSLSTLRIAGLIYLFAL
jgi:hypothetical protein